MRRIVELLLSPTPPLWRYCLGAAPLALIPSLALLSLATAAVSLAGVDASKLLPGDGPVGVGPMFTVVVFAPAVETAVLGVLLGLLRRLGRPVAASVLSALIWGALHGLFAPLWFFGTVWSFFVYSCAFLAWRQRSYWHGYAAAAVPHALVNLAALLIGLLLD